MYPSTKIVGIAQIRYEKVDLVSNKAPIREKKQMEKGN